MSAPTLDLDALMAPLAGDAPSGPDLVYDPDFLAMEQAAAGKPETQWSPAVLPEWQLVFDQALALSRRSRDLRVAVWLLRSGTRLQGLGGAVAGLALVRGLLEQLWDSVHPELDRSDADDPTMRMNALTPLSAATEWLADLRSATLAPTRGSMRLRDLELGLGRAEPASDETVPTEAGVLQGLHQLLAKYPQIAQQARAVVGDAKAIDAWLQQKVGAAAPELGTLMRLLALLEQAVGRAGGQVNTDAVSDEPQQALGASATSGAGTQAPGAIRSRSDATRELERVCEWIERNEPSNPAPLLIRRAQRLMDKSFLDIIRDLAPDGLTQVERIAGNESSS
jgi:type VI secretion system protein ImpA